MKLFSTKTHGILDYLTAGALLMLPPVLRPGATVANLLRGAAISTVAYSLLTDYELGAKRVLPMQAHLILDALSGATFAAAPLLFPREPGRVRGVLLGIGLFELLASLSTETAPRSHAQPKGELAL